MKKNLLIAAVTMMVVAMAGAAFAANLNPTVGVSASVATKCIVSQAATAIAFGALDPETTADQSYTAADGADLKIKCTKNKATTLISAASANPGGATNFQMIGGAGAFLIPYTFNYDSANKTGLGFGTGTDLRLNLGASVAKANFENAEGGAYADTVTFTITY